ncbi:MAG: glycogen/starch/alpha-glucan phosphorylase [Erysipelotrichaceae bacterium]|nr:glycogen/starch/alpha-glucan phosphorylase [Erysipelotrichaceae bacterium]MDY5727582.1 glycogen/starch/alpha-glucan phosphorylase [Erysipelotrichaceae bacterium]
MFTNKEEFKQQYCQRMIEKYGRSIQYSRCSERYLVLGEMVKDYASNNWMETKNKIDEKQQKQLYYFSMEFLIGRLLTNNLMNLGIYNIVKEGLSELGYDINELEEVETDAGLGNGGLGRLAACFLDSLASMSLPGHGNSIRYEYGLFKQKIENNKQVEVPDIWLKYGNPWEVRKADHAVDVKFYGNIETYWNIFGTMDVKHVNAQTVRAVPYDVAVIGKDGKCINTLRLWKPEASEQAPTGQDFIKYIQDVNKICQNVYPDDSTEEGRMLRIKQEYFFSSAGIQTIIKNHYEKYHTLDNLADKVVIQLNDTHPILIIPEMMRILLDDYHYSWDKGWDIVSHTVAYTNHTIMQEALEKWPVHMISKLLPRIYLLIQEINKRFIDSVISKTHDYDLAKRVAIIIDNQVHMAHLAAATVFSINGVAKIHTQILKDDVMKDFYHLFPEKFNNKTNGITPRRWLLYSNPQLTQLLTDTIGPEFKEDISNLSKLNQYISDQNLIDRFKAVKHQRKQILAEYIKKVTDIDVDVNSIFDVQAKRLHAYKRQMMNCMHIIDLYQRIKSDNSFTMHPVTFIFSAKAAPSYVFAKKVIELINTLAQLINNDPQVNKYMKVVFIPNYCVSIAEILMNAADVSEQISTAGKEASGTGNMKLMMNGAITLGTLDGANVEIKQCVGEDNIVIFGNTVEQLQKLRENGYSAIDLYKNDLVIKRILDSLVDGTICNVNFKEILDEIIYRNDEFFLLADYHQYEKAHKYINDLYRDNNDLFVQKCLVNIANSAYFSSDRTIGDYNNDIWHLDRVE